MLQKCENKNPILAIFDQEVAYCPVTGARLLRSDGFPKDGNAPIYRVAFNGGGWRYKVRAWTLDEAIGKANKRLSKEWEKVKQGVRRREWEWFMLVDQQATQSPHWMNDTTPDECALCYLSESEQVQEALYQAEIKKAQSTSEEDYWK